MITGQIQDAIHKTEDSNDIKPGIAKIPGFGYAMMVEIPSGIMVMLPW